VKAELEHPTLTIWNSPQVLKDPSWYLAGGIPDTFTYHLNATSNGPMSVSIMTFEQWGKPSSAWTMDAATPTTACTFRNRGHVDRREDRQLRLPQSGRCADYLSVFTTSSRASQ